MNLLRSDFDYLFTVISFVHFSIRSCSIIQSFIMDIFIADSVDSNLQLDFIPKVCLGLA